MNTISRSLRCRIIVPGIGVLFFYFATSGLSCAEAKTGSPPATSYVYATNEADNTLSEYQTKSDGTLQFMTSAPTGRKPGGVLAIHQGVFSASGMVFVLNRDDNTISQYVIENDSHAHTVPAGYLIPTTPPTIATGKNPSAITSDGYGHIYVTCQGDNTVNEYRVNTGSNDASVTSNLVFVRSVPTGTSPVDVSNTVVLNGDNSLSLFTNFDGTAITGLTPDTPPVLPTEAGGFSRCGWRAGKSDLCDKRGQEHNAGIYLAA